MKSAFWIILLALLAFAIRCHNYREVFVGRHIYFVDADCYSRMTRVKAISEGGDWIQRHHRFENWPEGVVPHTTAPLDYLILGLDRALGVGQAVVRGGFRESALGWIRSLATSESERAKEFARVLWVGWHERLDFAGALVSPLIGMAVCAFLGWWGRWGCRPSDGSKRFPWIAAAPALVFALSPVLVHGTSLGRPDHQSLLILCMAVALAAECRLAAGVTRAWGIASGIAWAVGLWVSLYEPLILLTIVVLLWVIFDRKRLLSRERMAGAIAFLAILAFALLVEGWRIRAIDPALLPYLARWSQSIGELNRLDLGSPILYQWLGYGCVAAPILLALSFRWDRRGIPWLSLLVAVFALTAWQLRWGYFLALIFVLALPWMCGPELFQARWKRIGARLGVWTMILISLWPTFQELEGRLFPTAEEKKQLALQRAEMEQLRAIAERMRSPEVSPFLAPWWVSPALAYWSGQPSVAGSSHESLPGIVDTARFYLAASPAEAAPILRKRQVAHIVADEPSRVIDTSSVLLGQGTPAQPLATALISHPDRAAPFLVPVFSTQFFKLFAVDQAKVTP